MSTVTNVKKFKSKGSGSSATADLRNQFLSLQQRRYQLDAELEKANAEHRLAQDKLLAGDPGTTSVAAANAYSTVASLRAAIAEIDSRQTQLEQQLGATEREQALESTRMRLSKVQKEITETESDFISARIRINELMESEIQTQVVSFNRWQKRMQEFNHLRIALGESPIPKPLGILCAEARSQALFFAPEIDNATDRLYRVNNQPTREQMRARNRELSRREAARQAHSYPLKHHPDMGLNSASTNDGPPEAA